MAIVLFTKTPNEINLRSYLLKIQRHLETPFNEEQGKYILHLLHQINPQIASEPNVKPLYLKLLNQASKNSELIRSKKGKCLPEEIINMITIDYLPFQALVNLTCINRAHYAQKYYLTETQLANRAQMTMGEICDYWRFLNPPSLESLFFKCTCLQKLTMEDEEDVLWRGRVTPNMLQAAYYAHHLSHLTITSCELITDEAFRKYVDRAPPLTHFSVRDGQSKIALSSYEYLILHCSNLTFLEIPVNRQVMTALPRLLKLETLIIDDESEILDPDLLPLTCCRQLTTLTLAGLQALTAEGMSLLFSSMPQLTSLDISNTQASDTVLDTLKMFCRQIRCLNTRRTKVTRGGLESFTRENYRLGKLIY